MSAVAATRPVFSERNIGATNWRRRDAALPNDEKAEAERAASVNKALGSAAPAPGAGHDRRAVPRSLAAAGPDPRDPSLVTISALIATGQLRSFPAISPAR